MSSKERGALRRQTTFHFIDVHPVKGLQNRDFVRSHVGSWVWEQKQNARAPENNDFDDGHDGNGVTILAGTNDTTLNPPAPGPSCSLHSIDCIGAATLDPFQTYPSGFQPRFVNWCYWYCLSVLWPGLMPSSPKETRNTTMLSWFQLSIHDSALFTLCLYSATSHQRLHWRARKADAISGPPDMQTLEILEFESIKRVNKAIQSPSRALSDAIILSVGCLANNRVDEPVRDENKRSPFRPPLPSLQWLSLYGSLPPNPVHLTGLAQLIKLREGLDKTILPGLASILSYSDILAASKALSRPQFPFFPLQGEKNPTLQERLGFSPTDIEHGFMRMCKIGLTTEMAEVFQAMKTYTFVVERYQDGSMAQPDMRRISDQRNLVQYHLLSLSTAEELWLDSPQTHSVYEVCRLAGLIFGVGVLFPLSAQTAPMQTLVGLLQTELQVSQLEESSWSSPDAITALTWVLTLGGIAATGLPERRWFVAALCRVSSWSGLCTWQDLKQVLELMLWLDTACDSAGEQLWSEVENSGSLVHQYRYSRTSL